MRWIIALGYFVAVLWFLFSLATFVYNYMEVRRLDDEIRRIRAEITVWKTDMLVLKRGLNLEVKDSTSSGKHDLKGRGPGKGK